MIKLLIADDEDNIREGMRDYIDWKSKGIIVYTSCDGPSTYQSILREKPDIVLIDIHMPGLSGLQVIDRIKNEAGLLTSFIVISGHGDFAYAQKAIALGVDEYLLKPCSPKDILDAVESSIRRHTPIPQELNSTDDFFSFYSKFISKNENSEKINQVDYPTESEQKLIYLLQLGTREQLLEEVENFFRLVHRNNHAMPPIINCCVMLYMQIYRLLMEHNLENNFNGLTTISWNGEDIFESLRTSILDTVLFAFDRLNTRCETNIPITKAVNFIHNHYNQPLSLDIVAQEVFISPSYLSGLFKHVLNVNFIDYIHKIRIDNAKTLLTTTTLKNYEISTFIGYPCEKYYSQVFKKYTGLTPSQYRSQNASSSITKSIQ